ncbi:TRAP transporter substrate-binding protein [Haloferax marisrubri]|nr:TRAP transporter substrate-binding protein [Haloferax marisrubri]
MTIASAFSEDHVLIAGAAQKFKEIVEEESGGKFTVQISPGGAYGAEDEISELTAEGGIEAHSGGTFPFLQYAPKYFFFANPFVMKDFDHILRLHESDLMEEGYSKIVENGNQRPVGNMVYRGARHLCTKEKTGAVNTPEDIEGLTLRVAEIPPWVQVFSEIGFDTAAITWTEVYSALQTGTADSVEAPPGALNSAQLYEVFAHLNITSHQITTGNIYFNEDFYQGLDKTYQDLVQQASAKATDHASQMAKEQEQSYIDTFKSEYNIAVNKSADRAAFTSAAEPAIKKLFDEKWAHTWEDVQNV